MNARAKTCWSYPAPPSGAPAMTAPDPAAYGALSSVLGEPTQPTIPLNKLAPEAALRRLELAIVRRRLPEVSARLAEQVTTLVQALRGQGLLKPPGVAETLDWARALNELGTRELDTATAAATLGVAVKYREDAERVRRALDIMLTT